MKLRYRIVNVSTSGGGRLTGNPLRMFEDGRGLDGEAMQALALQFNLSETAFILRSSRATVRAATHPELEAPPAELAAALGLHVADIVRECGGRRPLWVDSGSEQLLVPLAEPGAVDRLKPDAARLARLRSAEGRQLAYAFSEAGDGEVLARFLLEAGGALREDPATGSACANLGGRYLATGSPPPLVHRMQQGARVGRPSELLLSIDAARAARVGGTVAALGAGEIEL